MSNTTAQRDARNGAELGDLRRRMNDAALSTYVRTPAERATELYYAMLIAKQGGYIEEAREYARELKPLLAYLPEGK